MIARSADQATPEPTAEIQVRDLSATFGGVQALVDVNVDILQGNVTAIVGPNGAGKTTLLNAVGGILGSAVRGSVAFRGRETTHRSPTTLAHIGFGRSFQEPRLVESDSVLENVLAGAYGRMGYSTFDQVFRPWRMWAAEARARAQARLLLNQVGLAELAAMPVAGMPYGVRKLVDIARALAGQPHVLMLDEPTSGLDGVDRQKVRDIVLDIRMHRDTTVLLVEHHMDLVREVADVVVGMAAGRAIAIGTPSQVLDSEMFRSAVMGGNQTVTRPRPQLAGGKEQAWTA